MTATVFGDIPTLDYFGTSQGEQSLIVNLGATPIIFHNNNNLVFHDGSRVVFHDPIYPDIQGFEIARVPRIEYAGEGDI